MRMSRANAYQSSLDAGRVMQTGVANIKMEFRTIDGVGDR